MKDGYLIGLRALTISAALFLGCENRSAQHSKPIEGPADNANDGHSHSDADQLVWVKKGVDVEGYTISLGQHGKHFHFGDWIEPAAMITKDGEAIPDAALYNSLVSLDDSGDSQVLAAEVPMIFEPETDDEPAHYAQGKLHIPKEKSKLRVRFRIQLPGIEEEFTYDIDPGVH